MTRAREQPSLDCAWLAGDDFADQLRDLQTRKGTVLTPGGGFSAEAPTTTFHAISSAAKEL
jgi:hypothetical protein